MNDTPNPPVDAPAPTDGPTPPADSAPTPAVDAPQVEPTTDLVTDAAAAAADAPPGDDETQDDGAAAAGDDTVVPATEATVAEPATKAPPMSPAQTGRALAERFPALFAGAPKPMKLRIQADIQARAPGVFSRQVLGAFFRRYTGSHGYLMALSRAPQRLDLDGQPAGEISAEHRDAAQAELNRRRELTQARRQEEERSMREAEDARRQRAQLLRDFERTTLTPANFCALKGLDAAQLDAVLAQARQEAAERPLPPPFDPRGDRPHPGGHGPGRGPGGPDRRGGPGPHDRRPHGERRDGGPAGARPGPDSRGPRGPRPGGDDRRPAGAQGAPRGEGGPDRGSRRDGPAPDGRPPRRRA